MHPSLLNVLRCPECHAGLSAAGADCSSGAVRSGVLACADCRKRFPIRNGIPWLVAGDNYADSFGAQWTTFQTEQLDSVTGTSLSHDRFRAVTRWAPSELANQWTLDAGCGAGRFAEVALEAGAHVVAVDMSNAVEACYANLSRRFPDRLHVVRASIFELPFAPATFDKVFCIGAIQHTPDPVRAIRALAKMPKPGGQLALWIYELSWKCLLGWKYYLRPITRHLSTRLNYALAYTLSLVLLPVWFPLGYLGKPGRFISMLLPVAAANYVGKGYGARQCFRCVVLDTFDWYSPAYDRPQRFSRVWRILEEEGYGELTRTCGGVGIRGTRLSS